MNYRRNYKAAENGMIATDYTAWGTISNILAVILGISHGRRTSLLFPLDPRLRPAK